MLIRKRNRLLHTLIAPIWSILGLLAVTANVNAQWEGFDMIDAFQVYAVGDSVDGKWRWRSNSGLNQIGEDPEDASNKTLYLGPSTTRSFVYYPLTDYVVEKGTIATLFFRLRLDPGNWNINFGLSDVNPPGGGSYNDFEAQIRANAGALDSRDGNSNPNFQGLASTDGERVDRANVWYSIWMVVDHNNDEIEVYAQSDGDPAFATRRQLIGASPPIKFRFGTEDDLTSLYLVTQESVGCHLDDFFIDVLGTNLKDPTGATTSPVVSAEDDRIQMGRQGALAFDPTINDIMASPPSELRIVEPPSAGTAFYDALQKRLVYKHSGGSGNTDRFRYQLVTEEGTSEAWVNIDISDALRFSNSTLQIPDTPPVEEPPGELIIQNALNGLTFPDAVAISDVPGQPKALLIGSINGTIWYVPDTTSSNPQSYEALKIDSLSDSSNGRVIYSFTCYPDFATTGQIIVNYQADLSRLPPTDQIPNLDLDGLPDTEIMNELRVSRFTLDLPATLNGLTNQENNNLIETEYPFINMAAQGPFHTINDCKFGADGYLYISFGDEGGQGDPYRNGQTINRDYYSSLIRIDVDPLSTNPKPNPHYAIASGPLSGGQLSSYLSTSQNPNFRIPADNPLIHTTRGGSWDGDMNGQDYSDQLDDVRTEIWALGLRNPFKFHLDTVDGLLGGEVEAWIGDVGNKKREEVNLFRKGANGGWSYFEGDLPNQNSHPTAPAGSTPHTPPLWHYQNGNSMGKSITGGILYRRNELAALTGLYICGDYSSGRIWSITPAGEATELSTLRLGGNDIVDFEFDHETGDIFVLEHSAGGRVMRITEQESTTSTDTFPRLLSQTGIFADHRDLTPNLGVVPYEANLSFWSDGARKSRWFIMPNETDRIGYENDSPWNFPEGMVWVKHFDYDLDQRNPGTSLQRLETRVLVRNAEGAYGVSYRWNNDGTDAVLADRDGESFPLSFVDETNQQETFTWEIPSRVDCMSCHTPVSGYAPSFNTRQLNRVQRLYSQEGNMLQMLKDGGYFQDFTESVATLPRHYQPDDTSVDLGQRFRSYLEVNCAYCHQPGGSGSPSFDARGHLSTEDTRLLYGTPISEAAPNHTDFLVVPGNPRLSAIWSKINARDSINETFNGYSQMPPLGSNRFDEKGIELVRAWIENHANTAPRIQTSYTTPENVPLGMPFSDPIATDPDCRLASCDQDNLSYEITAGNEDNCFMIDPASGTLFVTGWLDHEQAASRTLNVTVRDNYAPNPKATSLPITITIVNTLNEDTNNNGLPDLWEAQNNLQSPLPGADTDGDGTSDFFEFFSGGDPNSIASPGPVLRIHPHASGAPQLRWRQPNGFLHGVHFQLEVGNQNGKLEGFTPVSFETLSILPDGTGYQRVTVSPSVFGPQNVFRLVSP